jgi:hypothetical protein
MAGVKFNGADGADRINTGVHLDYVTQNVDNYQDDTQIALGFRYDLNLTWKD